ncbi:uncharacterized protein LOC126800672 isoform X2 [Argentina anserina]|uniref:uncharacterized protein LOC126800672 isoform X2 n=1 Tax=Argentina anserina TaxID=57926 RepID=UPI00217641A5|nr:uncharacterized protein LOC126800672 isoform X2 [Potentilla anserina]
MADPHPIYLDLADSSLLDDNDEASEEPSVIGEIQIEDSEDDYQEEEQEQLPHPQIEPNYAIYLSTIGPPDEPIQPDSDYERHPASGKRRKIGSRETAAFETGESSQGSQWKSNEIDGLFCPICMEAWTSDGDHCTCCLPCGHIFGMSCIKKWLGKCHKQKCPQCNARCKLKDIRKLFAPQVISVDEESQKRIHLLEAKCASHEKEQAEWHKREAKLLKEQGVLERKIQQLMESKASGYAIGGFEKRFVSDNNILAGRSNGQPFGSNLRGQAYTCSFKLEELRVAGARVFDVDTSKQILLISRRHAGIGGKDVLTKMSLIPPYDRDDILLPSSINSIRDLRISPSNSNLALCACLGKKLAVFSTENNNVIVSYDLPAAAWTCSWDLNDSNYIYAGLQNGYLMVFDMRQTSGPVEYLKGLTSNPIHTVHSLSYNSALPPCVRTVMSASSIGLCLWNFGGAEKGPILVPETENQGVCISLAYCPRTDDIVASYRPKVEFSDETAFTQPMFTPTRAIGQGTVGSHVLLKRASSSGHFLKLGSSVANVCDIGLPKSAIINIESRGRLFAYEDKLTSELVLKELSSSTTVQRLNLQQGPVHDVKYASSSRKGLLGCLNGDTLQLFCTKLP